MHYFNRKQHHPKKYSRLKGLLSYSASLRDIRQLTHGDETKLTMGRIIALFALLLNIMDAQSKGMLLFVFWMLCL